MESPQTKRKTLFLPFILAFCLVALGSWLFIPMLLKAPLPQSSEKNSSKALAELTQLTYQDHVFFAPRAHNLDSCNQCHAFSQEEYMSMFNLDKRTVPDTNSQIFFQTKPLDMSDCLSCHQIKAHMNTTTASEACSTCHR